jgi:hypothetical protein
LQGTSLFSIFCSATLLVTSRKQGFCAQSTGGVPGGPALPAYQAAVFNRPTLRDWPREAPAILPAREFKFRPEAARIVDVPDEVWLERI